jgi:hypothetical protein
VQLPESWTERLPILERLEEDWQPVPRWALILAVAFYAIILLDVGRGGDLFGLVFLPVHEGGHLLFGWFAALFPVSTGEFIMVAGGTAMQLGAPVMLAIYFAFRRQALGVAFCIFFFCQQFLPIAIYMADARSMELPLVTVGDTDNVVHDWNYLFGKLHLLDHDTQIASLMRIIGWIGMLATVAWLLRRGLTDSANPQSRR